MVSGKAMLWFETGMEGCEWAVVYQEPKDSKYYLHFLQNGEKLKLYEKGREIWRGTIEHDITTNLTNETGYDYQRQVVGNRIVHWLQKDVDPDQWLRWLENERECELENLVGDSYLLSYTGPEGEK